MDSGGLCDLGTAETGALLSCWERATCRRKMETTEEVVIQTRVATLTVPTLSSPAVRLRVSLVHGQVQVRRERRGAARRLMNMNKKKVFPQVPSSSLHNPCQVHSQQ